jgi:hypothetical protein
MTDVLAKRTRTKALHFLPLPLFNGSFPSLCLSPAHTSAHNYKQASHLGDFLNRRQWGRTSIIREQISIFRLECQTFGEGGTTIFGHLFFFLLNLSYRIIFFCALLIFLRCIYLYHNFNLSMTCEY